MKDFIKINENDNVIVALKELTAGRPFWREHRRLQQGNDPGGTQDGNPRYCGRSRGDQIRF